MRRAKLPVLGAGALVLLLAAAPVLGQADGSPAPRDQKSASTASAPSSPPSATARPATPSAPPVTSATAPAANEAVYTVRIQDLERRVEELRRDETRRRNTREALARDARTLATGVGSRISIRFKNALSRFFMVTGMRFALDGAVQYTKNDPSGALGGPSKIAMFNGQASPGKHIAQMVVTLQGNAFGPFSYLRGYRFELRSTYTVTAVAGKTTDVDASAGEKGDATMPFEQRPTVRYTEQIVDGSSP